MADISQIQTPDGTIYTIKDPVARSGSFVAKTGDDMTGRLRLQRDPDNASANPAWLQFKDLDGQLATGNNTAGKLVGIITLDKHESQFGALDWYIGQSSVWASLSSTNRNSNGDLVSNTLKLTTNNDGSCTYSVSSPANFRSAISAAASDHTHTLSLASDSGTSQIALSANTKYKLTAGGNTVIFTTPSDTNTTYSVATGDNNGQIKVTPSSGSAYNVSVKGLGSAAYLTADTAASANTVVKRTADKYVYATYYNSNISNEDVNSYSNVAVMFTSDDKWIRRTSRLSFAKYLTNQNITSPGYFVTLTDSWGSFGYSNAAQARSGLGLGSMATQNTGSWEPIHPYLWSEITRNSVTQAANSNDYWTMTAKTFPSRSGYSRYVPVINFSNNNIVCTKWEINSSNQVLIYTRNLASSSQTFNIYIVAMYLRDTKKY